MGVKQNLFYLFIGVCFLGAACTEKKGKTTPRSYSERAGAEVQNVNDTSVDDNDTGNPDIEDEGETTTSSCTCLQGYQLREAEERCTRTLTEPPTNLGTSYQVCDALDNVNYGKFGAQYPNATKVQDNYWGDNDGQSDGRLNSVGIWACNGDTGQAGSQPNHEWIGFSYCMELSAKADYLVGIAGDNQVRLKLNGDTVFEIMGNVTKTFNYWWIYPLNVNSGLNIIEMEGYNFNGPASFGAEISGPFPYGSMVNDQAMIDADYASNIVFSTELAIGGPFDVGESSGLICPENYSLNRCTEQPICTYIDSIPCTNNNAGETNEAGSF